MVVGVIGDKQRLDDLGLVQTDSIEVVHAPSLQDFLIKPDALFFLEDEEYLAAAMPQLKAFNCLVIVNAVANTLQNMPAHFCRINGWPGFLTRPLWEVAAREADVERLSDLFSLLNKKVSFVADEPGMISARTIAMIINEAFFALQDGVSTRDEIDMAMKLGTNYPYGPFEWCSKIGAHRISSLLRCLAVKEAIYQPALQLL